MSEPLNELAAALAKAQAQIKGAIKDSQNPHFRSSYADLAAVWEACRVPLSTNGLAVIQSTDFDNDVAWIKTILVHSSGQKIEGRYPLRPIKNDPQGYGSALTYARRYCLAAMVGVAPDDDDDGNAASGRDKKTATNTARHDDPPPQPATLSKADARPVFDRMVNDFCALKTVTEVDAWWAASKRDRQSIPEGWRQELAALWTAHKKSILDAMAQRHGIPADNYQDAAQ